jgi:hypothetical protein
MEDVGLSGGEGDGSRNLRRIIPGPLGRAEIAAVVAVDNPTDVGRPITPLALELILLSDIDDVGLSGGDGSRNRRRIIPGVDRFGTRVVVGTIDVIG